MKKNILLSAMMILFPIASAFAQPGFYLGGGLVYNAPQGSDNKYLDPGFGLNMRFGYNFGRVAVEGNVIGSEHDDVDPGFGDADFDGFSIDAKFFLSREYDPTQFYLLAGVGYYSVDEFDPFEGADTEVSGNGWNLGAGLEQFVNLNLALNFGVVYRFIRFDEFNIGGFEFPISEDADMLTIEAGVVYHF